MEAIAGCCGFVGRRHYRQECETGVRVIGDQASYLRVMIRSGQLLADTAESLGYKVLGIDPFRARPSTVTGERIREEVVVIEWPQR